MIATLLQVVDYLPTIMGVAMATAAVVLLPAPANWRIAAVFGAFAAAVAIWTAGVHHGEAGCADKLAAIKKDAEDETARRATVLSEIQVQQNRRDLELQAREEALRRQQKENDRASRANDNKPCFDADSMRRIAGTGGQARRAGH